MLKSFIKKLYLIEIYIKNLFNLFSPPSILDLVPIFISKSQLFMYIYAYIFIYIFYA